MNTGYILAITRGHNSGACLLKDGEIVFAIEEERLSRQKYDGGPFAAMTKVLEYTDKIDALVIAHTQTLEVSAARVDFSGDDIYTGFARKLGLIDRKSNPFNHPQVVDLSTIHHKLHAGCAFYRSGFDDAVAVIVDGAGTFYELSDNSKRSFMGFEVETIIDCEYPYNLKSLWKHLGTKENMVTAEAKITLNDPLTGPEEIDCVISDRAGIVKVYEAVTEYCGFSAIEAGKTMGLFPYGEPNSNIPNLFETYGDISLSNRNAIIPTYPNSALVNDRLFSELKFSESDDLTMLQNRRDMAYALQKQTQDEVVKLIRKAVEMTGKTNVVISGGFGLNCVANYHYLEALKDDGIKLYVEPVSNDAGTSIGAALMYYHHTTQSTEKSPADLYLGPAYTYSNEAIKDMANNNVGIEVTENVKLDDVVDLVANRNIVTIFQGKCENGPRALGNRSIIYDPTDPVGKDFVNSVKNREYFRPFAGSILAEDVHDWFDLRGMDETPHMMYAVNCRPGIEEKIPSIIHEDGTCRIQTVTQEQNYHYYNIIKAFKDKTGIPMVFNTSFNLGGDPLVETLDHAIDTLIGSKIDYLYLPENDVLITVKNAEIV